MVDFRITPSQTETAVGLRMQSDVGFHLHAHSGSECMELWVTLFSLWAFDSSYGQRWRQGGSLIT